MSCSRGCCLLPLPTARTLLVVRSSRSARPAGSTREATCNICDLMLDYHCLFFSELKAFIMCI